MMNLSFEELRAANVARLADAFPQCKTWTGTDWGCALAGEAGEACNVVKKVLRGSLTVDDAREMIAKELADVVTYADLMAHHFGIDLGLAVREKFNEVSARVGSTVHL